MIKTRDLVPNVYYNESRDFQILGRTFEILFNYIKTNVDLMEDIPFSKNCDTHLLPLFATSLGFTNKRNYSREDLMAVCSSFAYLLKIKGTKESIQRAVNVMLHAYNINQISKVEDDGNFNFNVYIPYELKDTTLLDDIFEYILPCGYTYSFINTYLGDTYTGAQVVTNDRIAYRLFNATINGNIGLISSGGNLDTPIMPNLGEGQIPQDKTSMVSSGTIVIPEKIESEE